MQILKKPNGIIYDTKDPKGSVLYQAKEQRELIPLHHTHEFDDYEFLSLFFPEGHPIFDDFGKSYYYRLSI